MCYSVVERGMMHESRFYGRKSKSGRVITTAFTDIVESVLIIHSDSIVSCDSQWCTHWCPIGQIHLVQVVNRMAMWYPPDSTGGEISLYVVRVYYRSPRFRFKINIHYYTTERDWVALLDGPAERQLFMQVKSLTQTSTLWIAYSDTASDPCFRGLHGSG